MSVATTQGLSSPTVASHGDRERLVDEYEGLVRRVARRLMKRLPAGQQDFEEGDFVGTGILGLFDAANRFDPEVGYPFETFAEFRIKGAMLDELRRRDFFPRRLRSKANALAKSESALRQTLGREPSDEELARASKLSVAELRKRREEVRPYHWVDIADAGKSLAATEAGAFETAAWRERWALVTSAVERLPERERLVVDRYYRQGLTLREIGESIGLTVGRISQIKQAAVERLRQLVAA